MRSKVGEAGTRNCMRRMQNLRVLHRTSSIWDISDAELERAEFHGRAAVLDIEVEEQLMAYLANLTSRDTLALSPDRSSAPAQWPSRAGGVSRSAPLGKVAGKTVAFLRGALLVGPKNHNRIASRVIPLVLYAPVLYARYDVPHLDESYRTDM